jgi:hypothetical protein
MDIKVYGIRAVRHESSIGSAILYGIPVTFYAETAPAGYSHLVSWNVETMHDMFTRAMPAAGHGAAFTTQFQPSSSNGRFWAQIYADSYPTLLAPDVPQSLSGQALIPSPDQLSKRKRHRDERSVEQRAVLSPGRRPEHSGQGHGFPI